ncbi:MAG: ribose 5-phosphate isomerase A [Euryarchaeota archaeon]|nr:ribose 5-phosphate isomerase A [Euryarchaeota archaeon]|tara:strand:+ start:127 stop:828 length:702 start_codon:yes stop_codon:yes gene_type:complete
MTDVELLKEQAGIAACRFIKDGMALGLGTGSTVRYSIIEIARMISEEGMDLVGVPTSKDTMRLSEELDIPLRAFEDSGTLDLTIDGADEFDHNFDLIKGGGGALTREKVVALKSKSMVVVADNTKKVDILGEFDLPVEVEKDRWEGVREEISRICPGEVRLRENGPEPFETDNHGFILDCSFGPTISKPKSLERDISDIPGVVEVGLFVGICDAVILASSDGVSELIKPGGRI